VLSIASLDADKNEGNKNFTPFTFTINRQGGDLSQTVAVNWTVSPGQVNGVDGKDFFAGTLPTGIVILNPGITSKTFEVDVHGDYNYESGGLPENFVVTLSDPSNGATIDVQNASATGQIINDDHIDTSGDVGTMAALAMRPMIRRRILTLRRL